MGETANFTCRARGTNISSISWEIDGMGNYRDCSNQTFCVMPGDDSVSSTFTVNSTRLGEREFTVFCVVNQIFGDRTNMMNISRQLTVRPPPPTPTTTTSKTHIRHTQDAYTNATGSINGCGLCYYSDVPLES